MRKRFGCLLLLLASLASAQYKTSYTGGATDLTGYAKTGTNLWKSLTGQCKLHSAAVGSEGHAWCVGTDGYVYKYTTAWIKQTAMGTAVVSLAVQNDNVIYSLQPNATCGRWRSDRVSVGQRPNHLSTCWRWLLRAHRT